MEKRELKTYLVATYRLEDPCEPTMLRAEQFDSIDESAEWVSLDDPDDVIVCARGDRPSLDVIVSAPIR